MEVHHAHHPTHKKKISEYFLEFFMLFFAVTLGFFAENQREHYIEGQREIQYMESLIEDLAKDKYDLSQSKYQTLISNVTFEIYFNGGCVVVFLSSLLYCPRCL